MSLRMKLTIWTVLIACVLQLSIGLILQLYQTQAIEDYFDSRTEAHLSGFTSSLRGYLPNVNDSHVRQALQESALPQVDSGVWLTVVDNAGNILATNRRPAAIVSMEEIRRAAREHRFGYISLRKGINRPANIPFISTRACVSEVVGTDGQRYYFVLEESDMVAQQMLTLLRRVILISVPVSILATSVAAWIIAGIAVRPLHAIRAAAVRLRPESISSKIEVEPWTSEVQAVREELETARKSIEYAFAAQERFMSNVSHELKTPIAVLLTEAQNLRNAELPESVNAFLRSQQEELERLAMMVSSFLLLTQVRGGKKQPPIPTLCPIRDVLVESYAACAPFAKQYHVKLDLRLPEGEAADAEVLGNADLLRVVFDNIVRNAIRFSPEGATVLIHADVTPDHLIRVCIRDHGMGIPPELLSRIFDRFAQAPEEHRRGRGHGLGLEIALGIAELHSGAITAANCPDGGCEFTVTLPAYTLAQSDS